MTRRVFLHQGALAMFGVGASPLWLERAIGAETQGKVLVTIFQRGAADGLNMVVPYGEKAYYAGRPTIAVPPPGPSAGAALDLNGFFGLHPRLAPLRPLFLEKKLAVVHATGSPDLTRSHFDAQDYMESGTPGLKATRDGWLNRALPRPQGSSPLRAVSLGPVLPRALRGPQPAVALNSVKDFSLRDRMSAGEFQSRYQNTADPMLAAAGKETFAALRLLEQIRQQSYQPANGASYPAGRLGRSLEQIAQLIKARVGLAVAFDDVGGWDHHVNEAPLLGNMLGDFAAAIAAFSQDLGPLMEDVVLVTMSEFGRTARENGSRGTDHGHGNVMLVAGGAVQGGKVYGDWPGLEREQLHEARDLAVTTDFRTVLGEILRAQLGIADSARVFPGFQNTKPCGLFG